MYIMLNLICAKEGLALDQTISPLQDTGHVTAGYEGFFTATLAVKHFPGSEDC
jgi:hypothetical protein